MARKLVSNQEVIDASNAIVAENNGKIGFEAWKTALSQRLETNVEPILAQLLKKKTFILWLDGKQENGLPNLFVVSALPTPTEG